MLKHSAALAVAAPALTTLLAACGSDDEDPTATAGTTDASPTTGGGDTEATPTESMGDATPTEGMAEETPTEGMAEETPTEGMDEEPTATTGETGEMADQFGRPIEPPQNQGGIMIWGTESILVDWSLVTGGWDGLSEALTEVDPIEYDVAPLLATAWESNDDASVWTFTIREGVLFHDGTPMTANDVVFTYQMHAAEDNAASATVDTAEFAERVATIEAPDDYTVVMTLATPEVDWIINTPWFPIVSQALLQDVPPSELLSHPSSTGSDASQVVFTGPFKFVSHQTEAEMVFERFDDYWNGAPALDQLVFQVVPDLAAQTTLLLSGGLDAAYAVDKGTAAEFEGSDIEVVSVLRDYWQGIGFNLCSDNAPYYQEKEVRHALFMGIDRPTIVETVFFGFGAVQETIFPPDLWANDVDAVTVRYPYDPDLANQMLDDAGWLPGADGIREKDGVQMRPRLVGGSSGETLMVAIQDYWRALSVAAEVQIISDAETTTRIVEPPNCEKDYDSHFFFYGWGLGLDAGFNFRCTPEFGTGNRYNYCNEEVDALQQQILQESDPEVRIDLLTQMQNLILEDLPVGPIIQWASLRAYSKRFHNVYMTGYSLFANCNHWWVDAA
jgi:peptide/nickel transport system substrate-binding protein